MIKDFNIQQFETMSPESRVKLFDLLILLNFLVMLAAVAWLFIIGGVKGLYDWRLLAVTLPFIVLSFVLMRARTNAFVETL